MLQNPQWDFHSLVGLRDWLAKQPADGEYGWESCQTCVVGRYLQAHGHPGHGYSEWIMNTTGAVEAVTSCFTNYVPGGGRQTMTYGMALAKLDAWMATH